MSAHTVGPWVVEHNETIVSPHANSVIAVVQWSGEGHEAEDAANARLLASAPDLLNIAKRWAALEAGAWHAERHARDDAELRAATKACIAIATGEQP